MWGQTAGALRLPALRAETGVSIFVSRRVRYAYPPYGLKSAYLFLCHGGALRLPALRVKPTYMFLRRVGKRQRTHRASELTLR